MINPMINAQMALISTAPAAKSLIFLIFSFLSGETKSAKFSMAVFMSSRAITRPMAKTKKSHSDNDKLK